MKHLHTFENFTSKVENLDEAYSSSQIDKAVQDGIEAFWEAVAWRFPEIKTGDFAPADAANLEKAMKVAVTAWAKQNSK